MTRLITVDKDEVIVFDCNIAFNGLFYRENPQLRYLSNTIRKMKL